ncbi:MAG TPA: SemiSWEET transporter [Cyclobacteriaceae bacterium]|nr:SemiSWEET transporter [Cyclobacteriaceae bacterium]HMV11195.1 SemiSWEET transporter [Cyclobacteriaceae bacterium]HMV91674.1 SemiSWEET transporter [Cyclobacteriaceae bacterium]HMX01713.1 SemiSWEET transporter [Cyclobacteriaceae bacterium]HMX51390.1 SemiSWEET transporter [Cyclobacteriaceae bacterium]
MSFETIVGIGASAFTSTALLPQLIKILREKKANDISLAMLIVLFTGLALWVWYGFIKKDWIIIIANTFAVIINLISGILTIHYKHKNV